jgi:hypothetical protein
LNYSSGADYAPSSPCDTSQGLHCGQHPLAAHRATRIMKTTRYFEEQVLRKRPYIQRAWCEAALIDPIRREIQNDGRIRHWIAAVDTLDQKTRILRVVTLDDGETVHNAFFDRDFS